jgi:hypothetical protein
MLCLSDYCVTGPGLSVLRVLVHLFLTMTSSHGLSSL